MADQAEATNASGGSAPWTTGAVTEAYGSYGMMLPARHWCMTGRTEARLQ